MDNQATEGEEPGTLNREDKATLTLIRDVQHHIDLPAKVTVQENSSRGFIKFGTQTYREQAGGTTYKGY